MYSNIKDAVLEHTFSNLFVLIILLQSIFFLVMPGLLVDKRENGIETTRRQNNSSSHVLRQLVEDHEATRRHFMRQLVDTLVQS